MDKPTFLYSTYLSTATVTATDSFAGTDPADVLLPTEDVYWRPANTGSAKELTIDLAEPRNMDHIAFAGEGMDGVTVDVEGSSDNFATSEALVTGAALDAPVNAGWLSFAIRTYRYLRVRFTTFPSAFRVAFVCVGDLAPLPFLEEDYDPGNLTDTGQSLVSPEGLYLGNTQMRTMRRLNLDFGTVTEPEFTAIKAWADACIARSNPFFFVPDSSKSEVYFGWLNKPGFSAPYKNGMRSVSRMTMLTRAF